MQNTDIYQHRRHSKNLLMVHLIFVTKYRKDLFFGEFRNDIKQYMYETCVKYHWYIKRMETDKDHIHILLLGTSENNQKVSSRNRHFQPIKNNQLQ